MTSPSSRSSAVSIAPDEISVPAQTCTAGRIHHFGGFVDYESARWIVKGLYLGAASIGKPELFYILSRVGGTGPNVDGLERRVARTGPAEGANHGER